VIAMTAPDIDGLVERLEKASGPDRQLDGAIAMLIDDVPDWCRGPTTVGTYEHPKRGILNARRFTESIDAAMTLVPEGWCWGLFDEPNAWLWPTATRDLLTGIQGKGATPAIALCIAALRARAQADEAER
jgi:hypothetical protein